MATYKKLVALLQITVILVGCSHAVTASTDAVKALEISSVAAAASTRSNAVRTPAAVAAIEQAAPVTRPVVQQQVLGQPVMQQQVLRRPVLQQQVLWQPAAVTPVAAAVRPVAAGVPAARGAAAQPVLVPARQQQQQVVLQQPARQQQQQQPPVIIQQPARQQQQFVVQHPAAATRPVAQQPDRQQQVIIQQPVAAVRPGQVITAPVAMQPVAAARRAPVQQPRIVYVPVPVPVAAQPAAPVAPQTPKRPDRSGGLGGLGDLDFGLLPKLNLTSGLESFRSGLSGLLTDFQKNGGFWNAASRSENIANAVQLGVKGGLNLVAPIVNGIASSVPIMVPSLNGQCLQGKAVRPLKSNRKLIMCLVGTGAQVTDYILNAADSLAGMAGEVLDPETAAALQNSTNADPEGSAAAPAAAGDASAVATQPAIAQPLVVPAVPAEAVPAVPVAVPAVPAAVPAVPVAAPVAVPVEAAPAAAVPAASAAPTSSAPAATP